jgi:hypothetical protein
MGCSTKGLVMTHNVGGVDRAIRAVLGLAILSAGIYFRSWWGLVGILPLFTAAVRWCPGYLPFGISTCSTKARGERA